MSTIGYDSWAVDLANVGAVYPFQGSEVLMTVIGVGLWIVWHIVQIKDENSEIAKDIARATANDITHAIDRY